MIKKKLWVRVAAVVAAMAVFGSVGVPNASALTGWKAYGKVKGSIGPYSSRIDIGSITFVGPQAIRYTVSGTAPKAKVYLSAECRRPDGSWTKRKNKDAVVALPYTEDVTELLSPAKYEFCWTWVTAFPRTKINDPVALSIVLEAKYEN